MRLSSLTMGDIIEKYEDDAETVDSKDISYDYIILEAIRETMKLFREDFQNDIHARNKLINGLDSLDAALEPIEDDEYRTKKAQALDKPKEYFRNIILQLRKKKLISTKRGDQIWASS